MRICAWKVCDLDHREEPLKTSLLLFAFGLGWAATTIPASLVAQGETPEDTTSAAENFELSLFPGVQLRGEDSAIRILRLGLYNKNVSVKGPGHRHRQPDHWGSFEGAPGGSGRLRRE